MSNDLIRRSDAIRAVSKVDDYGDGIGFEVRSHCLVELELVPSADRPHGEWIYGTDEDGNEDAYPWTCSICGEKYPWYPNYCPNCGARMKGADDE